MGIETTFSKQISAAELLRRRFSVDDIFRMTEAGILAENERIELIDGEILLMSAKGIFHETLKVKLNLFFARNLPEAIEFAPETTFRLDEYSFLEPDFIFYRASDGLQGLNGGTALLAVEVADSSLSYDLGLKQRVYARFGIPELWVIDARKRETHIFSGPADEGYQQHDLLPQDALLTPSLISPFAVRLSELDLGAPES